MRDSALARRAGQAVRWRMAQLVGVNAVFLVRTLVLAWILVPDAFGLFAVALVPIVTLVHASELGMVPALVQSVAPERVQYDTAWSIGLLRSLLIAGVVLAAAPFVAALAGEPRAAALSRVLALHPVLVAAASIRLADLQRALAFRPLAVVNVGEALANTVVAIALARPLGVWALVVGMLAGSLARLVLSYVVAPHAPRLVLRAPAARSLVRFGRWVFATSMVSTLGGALINLGISRWLGVAELGVYYLARRLTFLLAGTVIDVGTSVAFPIYARLQDSREEAAAIFRAVWTATSALMVPAFVLLMVLAPSLVSEVLGGQWGSTAPVIRVLALVAILGLFGDVTAPLWQAMGQPWRNALMETVQVAILLTGLWSLTVPLGVVGAALAWVPAVMVSQLLSAVFLPRVLPNPMAGLGAVSLTVAMASAAGAAVAAGIDARFTGAASTVAAAVAGAALAAAVLWRADVDLGLGLKRSLLRVFPLPLPLGSQVRE